MGVFQRKGDNSNSSTKSGSFTRRRSADKKKRYSHPPHEQNPPEKWSSTAPGPEVGEADENDVKVAIDDDFSEWTGSSNGQPEVPQASPRGHQGQTPVPKPRLSRAAKDPYAKRKAVFNQKPKLAPITETGDSGAETDSARSSRTSAVYENVVIDIHGAMNAPVPPVIIEEEMVHENGELDGDGREDGEDREEEEGREEQAQEQGPMNDTRGGDNGTREGGNGIGNGIGTKEGENGTRGEVNGIGNGEVGNGGEGEGEDTTNEENINGYYQNVMVGRDGSMVINLSDGLMPSNDLNKDNEEEGLYDFVGGHLATGVTNDKDNGIIPNGNLKEEVVEIKEINTKDIDDLGNSREAGGNSLGAEGRERMDAKDIKKEEDEGMNSLRKDTGVGDGIISMEDLSGIPSDDPPTPTPSPRGSAVVPAISHSTSTTMEVQTDTDIPPQTPNGKIHQNQKLKSFEIEDVEMKDTGVGTSTDDLDPLQSYEDLQMEIDEATGILDEVVFGKGRSTQTGDSLRWGGERSNQIVQVMNKANAKRPISACVVVDSTTNTLDTVTVDNTANLSTTVQTETDMSEPSTKTDMSHAFSETNLSSLASPSVMAGPVQRRGKNKTMIGLVVFCVVIVLAIIGAGVVVYFVYVQNQNSEEDSQNSYYYIGMELEGAKYEASLGDETNAQYISTSVDICTLLKDVFSDSSALKDSYEDCTLLEFRQGQPDLLVAHVKTRFHRDKIAKAIADLETSATETIYDFIKLFLVDVQNKSPVVTQFVAKYEPVVENIQVYRYVHRLSDYGAVPPTT